MQNETDIFVMAALFVAYLIYAYTQIREAHREMGTPSFLINLFMLLLVLMFGAILLIVIKVDAGEPVNQAVADVLSPLHSWVTK